MLERTRSFVIAGNARSAAERLNRYIDLGVTEVIFNWSCPPVQEEDQMRRLAEDVIPLVREHAAARAAAPA